MKKREFILCLTIIVLICSVFFPKKILAGNSKDLLNPNEIITAAEPAVVFIQTIIEGNVSAPSAVFNDNFKFTKDPKNSTWKEHAQTGVAGSGFIVTPDGYIVTNAHVVKFTENYKKFMLLKTVAIKEAEIQTKNGEINQMQENAFINGFLLYLLKYAKITNVTESVFTVLGKSIPGVLIAKKGFQAEIKKVGDPSGTGTGKDIAILKIETSTQLPTIEIGDSSEVQVGDKIYCVGYPGVATFHPFLKGESATLPTVTSGIVSAIKQMPGGWNVIQTDAAIYHGNSGGPALDSQGKVVGISTFGSIDYNTGQIIEGFNFLVPINIAIEFLKEIGVTPHRGDFDTHYEKALKYMWNGYYSKALKEFTILTQISPGNPYVEQLIQKCRLEIEAGNDKKEIPVNPIIGIFIGILVIIGILFLTKRKNIITRQARHYKKNIENEESNINMNETVILESNNKPFAYLIDETTGNKYKITNNTNIGRDKGNEIILNDPAVSSRHAKIKFENGSFIVYDLASTNGTFVNGNKITKQSLKDGDIITFAHIRMKFKAI